MAFDSFLKRLEDAEPADISRFVAGICPTWVDSALRMSGKATIRKRKLPADKAIWLVIGAALFANKSLWRVVEHMRLVIDGLIAPSAVVRARLKLGSEPLRLLFHAVATAWNRMGEQPWRGLALYGLDGSHLRVDDSEANSEHFGRPKCRSSAGYPQMRMVALMNLTSRILAGAEAGPWARGEVTLARGLWNTIPDHSLTIIDRAFLSTAILLQVLSQGHDRHFLIRLKKNTRYQVIRLLADGSALATIAVPREVRAANPQAPKTITVRLIAYQHPGGEAGILMTSLRDPTEYPAAELISVYHKRWELEVAFDELKTHMLLRKEALRSKTVDGVYQEFWAIMLVYNLVRREMAVVAESKGLCPSRVSFTGAFLMIHNFFAAASIASMPGVLPRELAELEEQLGRSMILPPRRSERRCPRQVKVKMSNYKKAPPRHSVAA